jgi:hypothetical protein
LGEGEVAVLLACDLDAADHFFLHIDEKASAAIDGFIDAGGEEAGLEAGGAQHGLLGESDALDGIEFLRIDGLVDGDEIGLEMGDVLEVFEAGDAEAGGGEAVLAGVAGGAGLALGGAGPSGTGGIGLVGHELFVGDRFIGVGFFDFRHLGLRPNR